MSKLPTPLVSHDVDLRDFYFMPMDVCRLRDSRLAYALSGEGFRSAVLLWCASWHQVPAASLPDDDVELAHLAGYGRVVDEWKNYRNEALYGFVKCSDGRLYHPHIAKEAIKSWQEKLLHRWLKECDRLRKENRRRLEKGLNELILPERPIFKTESIPTETESIPTECYSNSIDSSNGIPLENVLKGQGKGQGNIYTTSTDVVVVCVAREREKENSLTPVKKILHEFGITGQLADDFITHRRSCGKKTGGAPITKTVLNGFQREADRAGMLLAEAVVMSIERNWQGFQAGWIAKDLPRNRGRPEKTFAQIKQENTLNSLKNFIGDKGDGVKNDEIGQNEICGTYAQGRIGVQRGT